MAWHVRARDIHNCKATHLLMYVRTANACRRPDTHAMLQRATAWRNGDGVRRRRQRGEGAGPRPCDQRVPGHWGLSVRARGRCAAATATASQGAQATGRVPSRSPAEHRWHIGIARWADCRGNAGCSGWSRSRSRAPRDAGSGRRARNPKSPTRAVHVASRSQWSSSPTATGHRAVGSPSA